MNDARFAREQRRGQDWQRRIFRAADLNRTGEPVAAVNENFIHTSQTGNVSHLNNRFSNKCRGNFFPPRSKEAPRPGRFRSPKPAFPRDAGATAPAQPVRVSIHHHAPWRKLRLPDRLKLRATECAGLDEIESSLHIFKEMAFQKPDSIRQRQPLGIFPSER